MARFFTLWISLCFYPFDRGHLSYSGVRKLSLGGQENRVDLAPFTIMMEMPAYPNQSYDCFCILCGFPGHARYHCVEMLSVSRTCASG